MSKSSPAKKATTAADPSRRTRTDREFGTGKSAEEHERDRWTTGDASHSFATAPANGHRALPRSIRVAESALNRGVFGVIDDRVVVEKAREGLAFAEFERLAGLLELTAQEQAALLSMTERTLARRVAEHGTLHPLESERLVLLQKLAEYGVEVFEDAGKFNRWLRRPLPLLGGKSPLQYLDMSTGFVVVEQVLGRLANGVYS
jgi:putative toxin-antitoxin system antitoxin component (TIGR02293 family)